MESSDDCFHGRSLSAEAADNRAASSLDIGWSSAEKYSFLPGPKHILYKTFALESTRSQWCENLAICENQEKLSFVWVNQNADLWRWL